MKKNLLLVALMLSMAASAFAMEVEIDGLWYEVVSKTKEAKVIMYKNNIYYCGSIVIPETIEHDGLKYSVTGIGSDAFLLCNGLTSVTIGNSVTSIGSHAFSGCSGLTSVTIPNSVTSIDKGAFSGCSGLTSITIPDGVTSIGSEAFRDCSGLTSFRIPNSIASIGDYTFSGCSCLTTITIGNSVTTIGEHAFSDCRNLTSVIIPNCVTSIGGFAFSGCSGLTSVTIPNSLTYIEYYVFMNCNGLTSITIPSSVTTIGSYAFNNCSGLTSITIPNSVTHIFNSAFFGCSSLTTINIGSGIKGIYNHAFANCPELTDVYCYAEKVPSTEFNDAFIGSYIEYATLHVPTASVDAYKATAPWSNFKTIMGLDGTIHETPKCATPTISYTAGKLMFSCESEGVEFVSEIKDTDIKKNYTSEVDLTVTYIISVYATKAGYENSDVATATLCWIDVEPNTEGIDGGIASVRALPVLIHSHDGVLTIEGATEGTPISVYNAAGQLVGSAKVSTCTTTISTTLHSGNVGIVRIGDRAVKMTVK